MGAIKDAIDLIEKLDKSINDRKILDLLLPIKQKIQEAKEENFELEKSQFYKERKILEEKDHLISLHTKEVSNLTSNIKELESQLETKNKSFVGSVPLIRS